MTPNETVSMNVRAARLKQGRFAHWVAKEIGLSPQSYSALESGQRLVRIDELLHLARILEVSVVELLVPQGGEDLEFRQNTDGYFSLTPAAAQKLIVGDGRTVRSSL